MKKIIVVFAFLSSMLALAYGPSLERSAVEQPRRVSFSLLPADNSLCVNARLGTMVTSCAEGTEFYTDQDGRCGCLSSEQVIEPYVCQRAFIRCNGDAGEIFSSLYRNLDMCGMIQTVFAGCGCYVTQTNNDSPGGVR